MVSPPGLKPLAASIAPWAAFRGFETDTRGGFGEASSGPRVSAQGRYVEPFATETGRSIAPHRMAAVGVGREVLRPSAVTHGRQLHGIASHQALDRPPHRPLPDVISDCPARFSCAKVGTSGNASARWPPIETRRQAQRASAPILQQASQRPQRGIHAAAQQVGHPPVRAMGSVAQVGAAQRGEPLGGEVLEGFHAVRGVGQGLGLRARRRDELAKRLHRHPGVNVQCPAQSPDQSHRDRRSVRPASHERRVQVHRCASGAAGVVDVLQYQAPHDASKVRGSRPKTCQVDALAESPIRSGLGRPTPSRPVI